MNKQRINQTNQIRNIAVIAHVDHGKTTLIDALLKQTNLFRDNQEEMSLQQILDSNELEKERGITIFAKNCSIHWQNYKINIIDTPGHADFSGEVERTLGMADGALLIVDAQEGPMPQTRFVLKKALQLELKIIVIINKIDKQYANVTKTLTKIEDLFLELAHHESQLKFPILYAIGRLGKVFTEPVTNWQQNATVIPLIETIVKEIPPPTNTGNSYFKLAVASLDYNPHLGRLAIGRIHSGSIRKNQVFVIANQPERKYQVDRLMVWQGLDKIEVNQAETGEIVAIAGAKSLQISDTLTDPQDLTPLAEIRVSDPTLRIQIGPNSSPFAGTEGEFFTNRQIEERLDKELESNVSLQVKKLNQGFEIAGMGELHLSILLETMRREGFEIEVSKPQAVTKFQNNQILEPVEELSIIVPEEYQSVINQELGKRLAKLIKFEKISDKEIEFIYHLPARVTIGLRGLLLTQTHGTVVYNAQLYDWKPLGKPLAKMRRGVLIADQSGEALAYGLNIAQGRGVTLIEPGTKVYQGMVVGINSKDEDIRINVCKGKKLTNMRSKSSDGILQLEPALNLSLEQSLDFIEDDELLEITPTNLRIRKKFLTELDRKNATKKNLS